MVNNLGDYLDKDSPSLKAEHDEILLITLSELKSNYRKLMNEFLKKFREDMDEVSYYGVYIAFQE